MIESTKWHDFYYHEKIAHKKTSEESKKRLAQIRHLLLENHQLHKELDQLRETVDKCFQL